ncbi:MAG: RcnB family protein [Arenimonas sp.]|jgi:Ni/Co efflux regulator RcnB
MKKTLLALTSSLLLAGIGASTASAQYPYYYEDDDVILANGDIDGDGVPNRFDSFDDRYDRYGNLVHFEVGGYLPIGFRDSAAYIDYRVYGLAPPPYGYRWQRLGNHVYMVSVRTGLISDVVYNLFP